MAELEDWQSPKLAKHALSLSAQVSSGTGGGGPSDVADVYAYGDDGVNGSDYTPGDPQP